MDYNEISYSNGWFRDTSILGNLYIDQHTSLFFFRHEKNHLASMILLWMLARTFHLRQSSVRRPQGRPSRIHRRHLGENGQVHGPITRGPHNWRGPIGRNVCSAVAQNSWTLTEAFWVQQLRQVMATTMVLTRRSWDITAIRMMKSHLAGTEPRNNLVNSRIYSRCHPVPFRHRSPESD